MSTMSKENKLQIICFLNELMLSQENKSCELVEFLNLMKGSDAARLTILSLVFDEELQSREADAMIEMSSIAVMAIQDGQETR